MRGFIFPRSHHKRTFGNVVWRDDFQPDIWLIAGFCWRVVYVTLQRVLRIDIFFSGYAISRERDVFVGYEIFLRVRRAHISSSVCGSLGTLRRYDCHLTTTIETIGEHRYIGSLNTEDILSARKELLNGWQKTRHGLNHPPKKGRSVPTVNSYMACLGGMLSFAFKSGYLKTDLMAGITPLAKERPIPDPLTSDEYQRVVAACPTLQFQNMVIFAVNTGVRHGELSALSWEDVDTVNWTVTVSRNYSLKGNFTLPKTNAGIRTIQLTQPAIDALKAQMPLTRMMASHKVSVSLREYKKKRTDECTFIFSPSITSMNGKKTMCYVPGSINSAWRTALRRAGVRQRRSYETRNTYACWALVAGANPNFVAHQMGHSSAQMLFTVYGKWMTENNHDQVGILNASFTQNAPPMPHRKTA